MEITVLHLQTPVPVAILHPQGELDGTSDQLLLQEIHRQFDEGFHNFVLDLRFVTCLDEAGLSTLRSLASLFSKGNSSRTKLSTNGHLQKLRLIHIPPDIRKTLDESGLEASFEVCTDLRQAIETFMR